MDELKRHVSYHIRRNLRLAAYHKIVFPEPAVNVVVQYCPRSTDGIISRTFPLDPEKVSLLLEFMEMLPIEKPRACALLMFLTCIVVVSGTIWCGKPLSNILG
jgi:hypothetical protein